MKVWEKCNEVKGTNATIEQIADWAYFNRICPLMFDTGLEIDLPLDKDGYPKPNGFLKTAESVCDVYTHNGKGCGTDCLMAYLNSEYVDQLPADKSVGL